MFEKRVDPTDGIAYTFAELRLYYGKRFPYNAIKLYWRHECVPEKRVDPFDGAAYTLHELQTWYGCKFDHGAIQQYWDTKCVAVPSKPLCAIPRARSRKHDSDILGKTEDFTQANAANFHPITRFQAETRLRTAQNGKDVAEMLAACRDAEDVGADASLVNAVRMCSIKLRLDAIEHSSRYWEMEELCKDAEAAGLFGLTRLTLPTAQHVGQCVVVNEPFRTWNKYLARGQIGKIHFGLGVDQIYVEFDTRFDGLCLVDKYDFSKLDVCDVLYERLSCIRLKVQALARVDAAASGCCADEMDLACDEAEAVGVNRSQVIPAVRRAARRLRAAARFQAACESSCAEEIALACDEVEACREASVNPSQIASLRQKAQRLTLAETQLNIALQANDAAEIERACCSAEDAGVAEGIVSVARRHSELLQARLSLANATCVSTQIEAALLVGQTHNHIKMAHLLSKVLAQHGSSHALSQLLARLNSNTTIFSRAHSRAYSLGGSAQYGLRGGKPYYKPTGWIRFSLQVDDFQRFGDWCIAYHGTSSDKLAPILLRGLQRPGDAGVVISHGQAHSQSGKSIYLSPSIEYAAFPVYSNFFAFEEQDHWGQLVFQCRVRPESYVEKPGSLGAKYWPPHVRFDPNFDSLDGLEWLVEDSDNVVVVGLMMREFGPHADSSTHGDLVCKVQAGCRGPEFEWTQLRSAEFESQGLLMVR